MPLCPRCRLRACAYQRPAFYGRLPRASTLCGECLRSVGADLLGSVIRVQPLPVRQGGSPAMPLPELEGGTSNETIAPERAPEPHDDCTRAVIEHDAPAPVTDLEATLRASLRPLASWASKPAARHAMARDLTVDLDAHERALHRRPRRSAEVSS